ncbi:hypothetical protein GX50_09013, partial [[Emmonsia] crescens]
AIIRKYRLNKLSSDEIANSQQQSTSFHTNEMIMKYNSQNKIMNLEEDVDDEDDEPLLPATLEAIDRRVRCDSDRVTVHETPEQLQSKKRPHLTINSSLTSFSENLTSFSESDVFFNNSCYSSHLSESLLIDNDTDLNNESLA